MKLPGLSGATKQARAWRSARSARGSGAPVAPGPAVAVALALAAAVLAGASGAAAQPRARVQQVITDTADVHDVAVQGDRLLLATSGGLVVMREGRVERVVTSRNGLPGSRMRSVSVLPEGVWVGGVEGTALLSLDDEGVHVVRRLPLRRVVRAVRFADATFLATASDGLFRLADGDGARPEGLTLGRSHARKRQTDLLVHGDELWVSTASAGILRVGTDGRLRGRFIEAGGLADDLVWDLAADGDRVLVGTITGISVIRDGHVVPDAHLDSAVARMPVRDVRALLPVDGALFVGTYGGGAFRIEGEQARQVGGAAGGPQAVQALGRMGEQVYVGHTAGLHRADLAGEHLASVSTGGLPSADVTALARAFGVIWVGTFHDGLARIEHGRVETVAEATGRWGMDRRVNDLAVTYDGDGRETLWIATDRGLWVHDGRSFTPVVDDHAPGRVHVTSLYAEPGPDAPLWVTSARTLSVFAGGDWQSWNGDQSFPVMQLHAVTVDALGRVWVGSLHGLYRFDPADGSFERHTVSTGDLPVDWVTALLPYGDGVVAGTYHGGLAWSEEGGFRIEQEGRGGVPAGWVNPHAMKRIGGQLFIGTLERGLVIGQSGAWSLLRTAQGLPSDDVTDVIEDGDGAVWVATRGGIARVVY